MAESERNFVATAAEPGLCLPVALPHNKLDGGTERSPTLSNFSIGPVLCFAWFVYKKSGLMQGGFRNNPCLFAIAL